MPSGDCLVLLQNFAALAGVENCVLSAMIALCDYDDIHHAAAVKAFAIDQDGKLSDWDRYRFRLVHTDENV